MNSYKLAPEPITGSGDTPPRVLVTGAAGRIGSSFCNTAGDRYSLRLLVRREAQVQDVCPFGDVIVGDLADRSTADDAVQGIDTVVHLAADPSPDASWDSVHRNNVMATHHVFAAAAEAGCRRVIFASSIHAVSGYPLGYQVHADDPVNPGDLYGVSKCFGEAMARFYAVQKGLSAIVLRIGAFQPREKAVSADTAALMSTFVSHRDLDQLISRCIDDESVQFAIFHALSNNVLNRMDIGTARELLGYAPKDDFTELNRELADFNLRNVVTPHDERHRNES